MRMVSDMGYCLGHLLCHIDDHGATFFFICGENAIFHNAEHHYWQDHDQHVKKCGGAL